MFKFEKKHVRYVSAEKNIFIVKFELCRICFPGNILTVSVSISSCIQSINSTGTGVVVLDFVILVLV